MNETNNQSTEPIGNTLSLDCATTTGWAVAEKYSVTDYGEIKLKEGEKTLWDFLSEITKKHNITRIVAEDIFYDKSVPTFRRLANYHGVINLFCSVNGIELHRDNYLPTQWKRAILLNSYATKAQVMKYVNGYMHTQIESDNTTDAIGILLAWKKRDQRKRGI